MIGSVLEEDGNVNKSSGDCGGLLFVLKHLRALNKVQVRLPLLEKTHPKSPGKQVSVSGIF